MATSKTGKFNISQERLEELSKEVAQDIGQAALYFDQNRKGEIIQRYQLLNSSETYYDQFFPDLKDKCKFTTTDIKDAVEWSLPAVIDVFLGAEDVVAIKPRGAQDNPDPLKKIMKFQIMTQNRGYKILTQVLRDAFEAGEGVLKGGWHRKEKKEIKKAIVNAVELQEVPTDQIKRVKATDDGMFEVSVASKTRVKDQPVFINIRPGEYIFIPIRNEDDRLLFECHRHYMLVDDLRRKEKEGYFKNTDKINVNAESSFSENTLDDIYDAMTDGSESGEGGNPVAVPATESAQDSKQMVMMYECVGYYDLDGDGLLEDCLVWYCGGQVVRVQPNNLNRSIFARFKAFPRSFQEWGAAIADFLQSTQDARTALIRQIIINTSLNNDKQIAIDKSQTQAARDYANGMKLIGLDLNGHNKSIKDFIQEFPDRTLAKEVFGLEAKLQQDSEKKTGISEHFQGLDRGGIHKTAEGVNMLMSAAQQRQKMVIHNLADGFVDFTALHVKLNQEYLDREIAIRIADDFFEFSPDDITGQYDVEISSVASMESSQYKIQSLLIIFNQVIPSLLNLGIATPLGVYKTAEKLIQQVGYKTVSEFVGRTEQEVVDMISGQQQQAINESIMQAAGQTFMESGMSPDQAAALTQRIVQNLSQAAQQPPPAQAA